MKLSLQAVVEQQVTMSITCEVRVEFLFGRGRRDAERDMRASECPHRIDEQLVCLCDIRDAGRTNAGESQETGWVDRLWKIDEAQLTILKLWLIDNGNVIVLAGIHWRRVAIILVGDIECHTIGRDSRDERHVSRCPVCPDAIGTWKDSDSTQTWCCP
jgi:hypothetical protein